MEENNKILKSPILLVPGLVLPIATFMISIKIVSKKDQILAYLYAFIAVLILFLCYYIYFNHEKAKRITELQNECDKVKLLLEQSEKLTANNDKKLRKVLKFTRESIRTIRRSCDMMNLSIGKLNTFKNKNNEGEIKNVITRYEQIKIVIDNLEGNLDE